LALLAARTALGDNGANVAILWGLAMRIAIPLLLLLMAMSAPARLAAAAGLEVGKDCHVILTCNFRRNASVRGCLSSYSCRQCSFVRRSVVSIDGVRRSEWRSSCDWGAS